MSTPLWKDDYEPENKIVAKSCLPQMEEACMTALLIEFPRDVALTLRLCFVSHLDAAARTIWLTTDLPTAPINSSATELELDSLMYEGPRSYEMYAVVTALSHVSLVNQLDILTMPGWEAERLMRLGVLLRSLPVMVLFLQQPRTSYPQMEDAMSYFANRFDWPHLSHLVRRLPAAEWLKVVSAGTLVAAAAAAGLLNVVQELLTSGCSPPLLPVDSFPLHAAIRNQRTEVVRFLLDKVDLNARDTNGNTPLHVASLVGGLESVRLLLSTDNVHCNAISFYNGTALHIAAALGRVELVRLLIAADKVDCNATTADGGTPLHMAILKKRVAVVRLLLATDKVECNSKDAHGRTPLLEASNMCGFRFCSTSVALVEIVRLLLSTDKVDCNATDAQGNTALHDAAQMNDVEVVRLLLSIGKADCNICDRRGRTALDIATVYRREESKRLILSACRQTKPIRWTPLLVLLMLLLLYLLLPYIIASMQLEWLS